MATNSSAKHLYGRGWLGLIPLVGGIVGIGLIILGIFKYRDKKLVFIGACALLFTVALYGSMIYYFVYSKTGAESTVPMTHRFLNNALKNIEFYKHENGVYPDSLELVNKQDSMVIIFDPTLSRGFKSANFNYRKIGNRYTLYSSGLDGISNTNDDIYPDSKYFDTSKFGLIKDNK